MACMADNPRVLRHATRLALTLSAQGLGNEIGTRRYCSLQLFTDIDATS